LTGLGGSTNGQGLGIDDFTLSATLTAIPEPSTWFAGGLTLFGLIATQRKRLFRLIKHA